MAVPDRYVLLRLDQATQQYRLEMKTEPVEGFKRGIADTVLVLVGGGGDGRRLAAIGGDLAKFAGCPFVDNVTTAYAP